MWNIVEFGDLIIYTHYFDKITKKKYFQFYNLYSELGFKYRKDSVFIEIQKDEKEFIMSLFETLNQNNLNFF